MSYSDLEKQIQAHNKNWPFIIGVDGRGGSGKSTFARLLAEKLGADIIETDDFASWERPFAWENSFIEKVIQPLRNGEKEISYVASVWSPDAQPRNVSHNIESAIIVEGVGILRKTLAEHIDFGIYVDTPKDVCFKRGVDRDQGYHPNEPRVQIEKRWRDWQIQEDLFMKDAQQNLATNWYVDGQRPFMI